METLNVNEFKLIMSGTNTPTLMRSMIRGASALLREIKTPDNDYQKGIMVSAMEQLDFLEELTTKFRKHYDETMNAYLDLRSLQIENQQSLNKGAN